MIKHRFICLIVSLFVRLFDVIKGAHGRAKATCVVLNYHSVRPHERGRFADQMDVLLRFSTPIPADAVELPGRPGNYAVLTFDDALEGVFYNALPELEKRGIPATIFVVADAVGKKAKWKDMGAGDAVGETGMSLEQLKSLPADLITVGSHSMTHPNLTRLDKSALIWELRESRDRLERMLSREVKLFSCPYGLCDTGVVKACKDVGYSRVFTGLPHIALAARAEFVTGRVRTTMEDTKLELYLKLKGAYRWLPEVISWKRRLILQNSRRPKHDLGSRVASMNR